MAPGEYQTTMATSPTEVSIDEQREQISIENNHHGLLQSVTDGMYTNV